MGMKGKRLYLCVDCGWKGFFWTGAFLRANRPRCCGCGSTFLDLVSDEGKDAAATGQAVMRERKDQMHDNDNVPKSAREREGEDDEHDSQRKHSV